MKELEVTDDGETHEAQEDSETVLTGSTSPLPSPGMGMKLHLDQLLPSQRKSEELDLEIFLKKAL